jgi:hypothetical protein
MVHAASGSSSLCPPFSVTGWPPSGPAFVFARKLSSRLRRSSRHIRRGPRNASPLIGRCRTLHGSPCAAIRRSTHTTSIGMSRSSIATTWWCAGCGGIDAPQRCLGICVWRPVEWVNRTRYSEERACALAQLDTERRLRQLLRRIAFVTPRAGQWRALLAPARGQGACNAPDLQLSRLSGYADFGRLGWCFGCWLGVLVVGRSG